MAVMFSESIARTKFCSIKQIKDYDSGRYFYIIGTSDYMDGGNNPMIIGYDTQNDKCQIYVKAANYYNPLGRDAEPWIYIENGDLILSFSIMGKNQPSQDYKLFWDKSANWFGYTNLGITQH